MQISGKFPRKGSERQNLINQLFTPQEGRPPHHHQHHQSNSGNYEVVIQLNPGLEDESHSNWSWQKSPDLRKCFCWFTTIKRKSSWRRPWGLRRAQNIMDPFFLPRWSVVPQQNKNLSSSVCGGNWTGRFPGILLC